MKKTISLILIMLITLNSTSCNSHRTLKNDGGIILRVIENKGLVIIWPDKKNNLIETLLEPGANITVMTETETYGGLILQKFTNDKIYCIKRTGVQEVIIAIENIKSITFTEKSDPAAGLMTILWYAGTVILVFIFAYAWRR